MIIEQWHKKWSVWLASAGVVLAEAYQYLPEMREALPADWYKYAFAIILVARLWKQKQQ